MLSVLARTETPEALAQLAAAGDRQAFARLARQLTPSALALATRVLNDRAAAEDATQDALAKLWREAGRFDPARGGFAAWWRRLLMNQALDARRRVRHADDLADHHALADPGPTPEASALATDEAERVNTALAALNARQRAALSLFHGEGLTMAEIADALDTTPKAVEGLLARARADLRARLTELHP